MKAFSFAPPPKKTLWQRVKAWWATATTPAKPIMRPAPVRKPCGCGKKVKPVNAVPRRKPCCGKGRRQGAV
jgi:hypothetical protein